MHPYVQYQITQLRVADMHREAQQHRIARAAHSANRQLSDRSLHRHGAALQHLRQTVLTGYGQLVRPASAAPQLPAGSRR